MKEEKIQWKFQSKSDNFAFLIPDERASWGGDFFINKKNFNGAVDGDRVETIQVANPRWKKPEVKVLQVLTKRPKKKTKKEVLKTIEWIYTGWNWNFGFIDVEWEKKGYFVYGFKKNGAEDGNKVKADVVEYNGKQEAIVTKILEVEEEIIQWIFSDNDRFGFVRPDKKADDIFIAGSRKAEAEDGDRVEVKIIKKWGRRPEGVVIKVL